MINAYTIGFVCVAAVAAAAVDYTQQARNAGQSIKGYSISDYINGHKKRYADAAAARDKASRQAELAKVHLPEAPDGWERREWERDFEAEYQEMLAGMSEQERQLAEQANNSLVGKTMRKKSEKEARQLAKNTVWEYVSGDQLVRLSAIYMDPDQPQSFQGIAMEMVATNIGMMTRRDGYAVVQGVPYFLNSSWLDEGGAEAPGEPVNLEAYVGDDIEINVVTNASPEVLRGFLEAIDYDGLNAMLNRPVAGIGSQAPVLTPAQELEVAEAAAKARFDKELAKSAALEGEMIDRAERISGGSGFTREAQQPQQTGLASTKDKVLGFFSGGDKDKDKAELPRRLQLSGGSSCLGNSTGRLCGD